MARRPEPVKKSIPDILADLRAGYREADIVGSAAALKYLERTQEGQHSLPNAVKCFLFDLLADTRAKLGDWQGCDDAVKGALANLAAAETDLGAELKRSLPTMAIFERGIQARSELGDFHGALELCDEATRRGLGAHFEAKRDSLDWAR
ncbi:MAG: hypothetical protein IPL96_02725 [Holophagaceae bacterium]|nr:hypothetical protein [Holophagaceae bacterium]